MEAPPPAAEAETLEPEPADADADPLSAQENSRLTFLDDGSTRIRVSSKWLATVATRLAARSLDS